MSTKIQICIFCAGILVAGAAAAIDSTDAAFDYQTDFAVPDAPAMKILDLDGAEILRPTSVRALGLAVADFKQSDNSIALPRKTALEFSPGLLIGGRTLSIKGYNQNLWLYRMRVSVATARVEEASTSTALAIGIRGTSVDASDLRLDTNIVNAATELAEEINNYLVSLKTGVFDSVVAIRERPEVKAKIALLEQEFQEEFLAKWTETKWNARIAEYALAALLQSPDSTAEKLQFQRFSLWYTTAWGYGSWGQLLLGARGSLARQSIGSDEFDVDGSLSARLYVGMNTGKVFAEGRFSAREDQRSNWLLNAGSESRLMNRLWVEFSAGASHSAATGRTRLVTDFQVKYGL